MLTVVILHFQDHCSLSPRAGIEVKINVNLPYFASIIPWLLPYMEKSQGGAGRGGWLCHS